MRILIASSKDWFNLKKDIQDDNEVKLISKKDELSLEFLNKFNPELIFFPIGIGLSQKKYILNINVLFFIQHLCRMVEEVARFKI